MALAGGRIRNVAALGDGAPGGGVFSNFGLWPALAADDTVAFTASVDGGGSSVGVFSSGPRGAARLAGTGDPAPGGGRLVTLTLYPAVALSPGGSLTFAAAPSTTGEGVEGLYLVERPKAR